MAKRGFIETPFDKALPASGGSSDFEGNTNLNGDVDISGSKAVIGLKIGDAPQDLLDCVDHFSGQA